jgi:hypothetical protein
MTTVTYGASTLFIGNRPWADIDLNPTFGSSATLKCLVDTGADYLQVNQADITSSGLSGLLAAGISQSILTAGGANHGLLLISGVSVAIEGVNVTVDILVDTTNSTSPQLAGRQVLLKAFAIGFDKTHWHH